MGAHRRRPRGRRRSEGERVHPHRTGQADGRRRCVRAAAQLRARGRDPAVRNGAEHRLADRRRARPRVQPRGGGVGGLAARHPVGQIRPHHRQRHGDRGAEGALRLRELPSGPARLRGEGRQHDRQDRIGRRHLRAEDRRRFGHQPGEGAAELERAARRGRQDPRRPPVLRRHRRSDPRLAVGPCRRDLRTERDRRVGSARDGRDEGRRGGSGRIPAAGRHRRRHQEGQRSSSSRCRSC